MTTLDTTSVHPAPSAAVVTPGLLVQPDQQRILVTEIPGPLSRRLQERRDEALPQGLGTMLPVFAERAGGGVIVNVDGNHLIDLASGIAVTSVGASAPAVVSRVQEQVAAALGIFEMFETHDLLARARRIETIVRERLEPLARELDVIAEVRGRGAMMAIELVRAGTLEPAPELARAVAAQCHSQGVILLSCGTFGNVIRLLPPLVIGEDLLVEALDILAGALRSQR